MYNLTPGISSWAVRQITSALRSNAAFISGANLHLAILIFYGWSDGVTVEALSSAERTEWSYCQSQTKTRCSPKTKVKNDRRFNKETDWRWTLWLHRWSHNSWSICRLRPCGRAERSGKKTSERTLLGQTALQWSFSLLWTSGRKHQYIKHPAASTTCWNFISS